MKRTQFYVVAVALAPFLLIAGTARWMMSAAYMRHVQAPYLAGTGYGTRLHGADCEVVVYGDSGPLVGIVPAVVERRTGLKTCNIADVAGVQVVNGQMVLDAYLRQNRRPKYLVFAYAPEDLTEPSAWTTVSTSEGVLFGLQYRPEGGLLRYAAGHPNEVMTDLELGFRTGLQWMLRPPLAAAARYEREQNGGHVREPAPALTRCREFGLERPLDASWLQRLRTTYGVGGTRVLIDVMPEPTCDTTLGFYRGQLKPGMIDNTLETMPIGLYTDTGRLHTTDEGAEELSERVATQIAFEQHVFEQQVAMQGGR